MLAGQGVTTKREIQLDVVRGVAILLAVGWHFNSLDGPWLFDVLMFPGRSFGWAGVDLFFVLSGFLVGRLILQETIDTGSFNYKRFLYRRVFRLWPVLYFYIAAQMVLTDRPWLSFVPQTLFHVQNYFPTPLSALWSLAVEEHFYLAAGLLIPIWAAKNANPRVLFLSLASLIIVAPILRWVALYDNQSYLSIQTYTHFRVDALATGVLMAALSLYRQDLFLTIQERRRTLALIAIIAAACLVPSQFDRLYRAAFGYNIAIIASAAFIFSINRCVIRPTAMPLARLLAFFGLYSYALYIWHNSTGAMGAKLMTKVLGPQAVVVTVCAKYFVAVAAAILVTKIVERPMLALRDKLVPNDRKPTASDEPVIAPMAAPEGR